MVLSYSARIVEGFLLVSCAVVRLISRLSSAFNWTLEELYYTCITSSTHLFEPFQALVTLQKSVLGLIPGRRYDYVVDSGCSHVRRTLCSQVGDSRPQETNQLDVYGTGVSRSTAKSFKLCRSKSRNLPKTNCS